VAQLNPRALGSLFVASNHLQVCGGGNLTRFHNINWVISLQTADLSSRQKGRPTETRPQLSDSILPTGSNIWSQVPKRAGHQDILTDWPSVVSNFNFDFEKSVYIQKVLRLFNTITVFRGFPWSQSKFWVRTQVQHHTACFTCSPPNGNIKIFALMYTS
jgi:hypothetical protein